MIYALIDKLKVSVELSFLLDALCHVAYVY